MLTVYSPGRLPVWKLALVAGALCGFVGCGGGSKKPAAPASGPVNSGFAKAQIGPSSAPPPVSAPEETPAANAANAPTDAVEAGPDDFALTNEEPKYAVVKEIPKADPFDMVPLAPGADSTKFELVSDTKAKPVVAPTPRPKQPFKLPDDFTAVPEAGYAEDGMPLRIRGKKDETEMAYIPAGVFIRGHRPETPDDAPEQSVYVDAYYIDVHEVTVEQYEKCREEFREEKKHIAPPANLNADPLDPVLGVNWGEARFYARWAGKELPTEAQWEKAGRGPNGFEYPWGNDKAIWERPRSHGQIDPVKSFRGDLSPYGVYDLAGNGREWCNDFYSDKAYLEEAASGNTVRTPTGPKAGVPTNHKVIRGNRETWALWARNHALMGDKPGDASFRCVLNLNGKSADADDQPAGADTKTKTKTKPKTKGKTKNDSAF
jgi:formylglycine-generating enzyme required for sulfatase activity